MERKLSAILVADIVGYSAQMERDEEGTFARVTARRKDLFEPEVVRHNGRIFKLVGDGVLVEFQSAVQAVECAVALQAGLQDRNRSLPEDQAIHLRIGINLGEVIVDGDDRYGEGVNLAARLEQLADAGGICVSEKVAREVERKLAFGFELMGERHVRNIAEPVHVYRVSPDRTKGPRAEDRRGGRTRHLMRLAATLALVASLGALAFAFWPGSARQASPPALAILPFDNVSGDAAQDYLGTGVADDIITMLSTSPTLRVVSKTSSFGLKGAGSLQGDRRRPQCRLHPRRQCPADGQRLPHIGPTRPGQRRPEPLVGAVREGGDGCSASAGGDRPQGLCDRGRIARRGCQVRDGASLEQVRALAGGI